jgi:hypothetical protein
MKIITNPILTAIHEDWSITAVGWTAFVKSATNKFWSGSIHRDVPANIQTPESCPQFQVISTTCLWSISTINLAMAHPVQHATCLFPIHSQSHKPYTQSSFSIQFHPFDDTINQVEIEMNTCESSVPKSARAQIFSCRCVPIYRSPHCYIPPDIQLFNKKLGLHQDDHNHTSLQ